MAKRSKTAARAGKVKGPAQGPEWKALEPKEALEEEIDSDDGSFLDDEDLGDFLPSAWTGSTKAKKESKPIQTSKKQDALVSTKNAAIESFPKATGTENMTLALQQRVILESTLVKSTPVESPSAESTPIESQLVKQQLNAGCGDQFQAKQDSAASNHIIANSEVSKVEAVTISRLEVPASLLRNQSSLIEELREQINSLER
ncbi:hypothetical protein N431DRAFT_460072 [Stipitochalara longipes BDJ]|nr:hypothetical protein N431DRAFT_460072 [Stipitochalara longipes BDJ]